MLLSLTIRKLGQHDLELFKVYHPIAISVHFGDDGPPHVVFGVHIVSQNVGNLLSLNRATAIFIEKSEGGPHVFLVQKCVLVDSGGAPLTEIDCTAIVGIRMDKDFGGARIHSLMRLVRMQPPEAIYEL